jgi:hypothetical protein
VDIPTHTDAVPVMAAGVGKTITVADAVHPEPNEYVIMDVPTASPVTKPLKEPIVATVVLPLVQPPPVTASPNKVVAPTQTESVPVMPVGVGLTDMVSVMEHPPATV